MANPDHILNPYAVQTRTLAGIRMAKQDAFACSGLFDYAHRSADVHVALLHTRTSARLRGTPRYIAPTNDMATCLTALTDAGYKLDAINETQLDARTNTPYRVIVASDSSFATQPETTGSLMRFIQSGGTLILTPHAITRNAYGKEMPEHPFSQSGDWMRGELYGIPLHHRVFGDGTAIRLDTSVTPQTLSLILGSLITQKNVPPTWECVDATTDESLIGIEVAHAVNAHGTHGLILFNRTKTTCQARIRLHGINTPSAFDLIQQKTLPTKGGGFLIELKPDHGEMITVSESN